MTQTPIKHKKKTTHILSQFFTEEPHIIEIGVDEAGRGPMFGRVYAAATILPKTDDPTIFNHKLLKDSKLFGKSKKAQKELMEAYEQVKTKAIAYSVAYEDEKVVDQVNILRATQSAMSRAIKNVLTQIPDINYDNVLLLIDGNYFSPTLIFNTHSLKPIRYETIEGGDNKYTCIAGASILAKVERDEYISALCATYPLLDQRYGLLSNKGYGAKIHMDGIRQYGITQWHRRTFGINKTAVSAVLEEINETNIII